ncbi:unnamed protein product [Polarella glacialis]|uniref:Uncharacterized protein n=1 Tax=Polarella glacialis TaxID=89957 RepID=A0A813LQ99_POLGL|nr:unnamed protein product [Polarella glacialis]|mmetsp:Transcript_20817/g.36732  ORF Transcript_20817/g.36732 Transcript_20817/m.36732 type:complete len:177 (+) Transcript_20817:78-608(+)
MLAVALGRSARRGAPALSLPLLRSRRLFASGDSKAPDDSKNPLSMLEQMGRETFSRAQEAAETLRSGGNPVQELQTFATSNAQVIAQNVVPLFSAMLILARSPGTPLTPEQQAKLSESLPGPAVDVLKAFIEVIPQDPQVVQLKRIADRLDNIEATLAREKAAEKAAGQPAVEMSE